MEFMEAHDGTFNAPFNDGWEEPLRVSEGDPPLELAKPEAVSSHRETNPEERRSLYGSLALYFTAAIVLLATSTPSTLWLHVAGAAILFIAFLRVVRLTGI